MAKKSSLRFTFDSPVTIILAMVSGVLLLLDTFVLNGKISSFVTCPASVASTSFAAFKFSCATDYVKIFLHVFGSLSWQSFFVCITLILAFGPVLEERYGPLMMSIMIFTAVAVNGVLTACLSPVFSVGQESVVFTMIFLSFITAFSKKTFPLSSILILIIFTAYDAHAISSIVKDIKVVAAVGVDMASGLCASLFGYMVAPKKRAAKTQARSEDRTEVKKKPYSSSDETVIGELSL